MSKDKIRNEIEATQKPVATEIPFDFVEHPGRKTTRLLATASVQNQIKGQHRWYDFEFREPIFISHIILQCQEYSEYSDFEFSITEFDGSTRLLKSSPKSDIVSLQAAMICKSISIRPPVVFLSDPWLIDLKIFGGEVRDLNNIFEFVRNFEAKKESALDEVDVAFGKLDERAAAVNALEAQRSDMRSQIESLKSQHAREKNKLDKARTDFVELTAKQQALDDSYARTNEQVSELRAEVSRLSNRRDEAKETISKLQGELKSLKENVNLFPSELSEFVNQGQKNIKSYTIFAVVPIAIIVIMFIILISGAANLTTIVTGNEKINLLAIAVSRAPFVTVAVAVITACFYLARMFVLEIVRVNRQRLNLTKISIIAKDTSYSIENGLDMSEDEIYSKRLKLKMDMMREHLRDYLGRDFEPHLPDIIKGGAALLMIKDGEALEANEPSSRDADERDSKSP